jgi:hypothetical protein
MAKHFLQRQSNQSFTKDLKNLLAKKADLSEQDKTALSIVFAIECGRSAREIKNLADRLPGGFHESFESGRDPRFRMHLLSYVIHQHGTYGVEWVTKVTRTLLLAGVEPHPKADSFDIPLAYAALQGSALVPVAELLIQAGADVNCAGRCMALHLACQDTRPDFMLLLLEHGADTNARDGQGKTPAQRIRSPAVRQALRAWEAKLLVKSRAGSVPQVFAASRARA